METKITYTDWTTYTAEDVTQVHIEKVIKNSGKEVAFIKVTN